METTRRDHDLQFGFLTECNATGMIFARFMIRSTLLKLGSNLKTLGRYLGAADSEMSICRRALGGLLEAIEKLPRSYLLATGNNWEAGKHLQCLCNAIFYICVDALVLPSGALVLAAQ